MTQFLHMGGYAAFVWPSYALVLAIVALNIYSARKVLREAQRAAQRRIGARGEPR